MGKVEPSTTGDGFSRYGKASSQDLPRRLHQRAKAGSDQESWFFAWVLECIAGYDKYMLFFFFLVFLLDF